MVKMIVVTDLHNTLVFANEAWLMAFTTLSGNSKEGIKHRLSSKESRHAIAKSLGLSYEDVYAEYRKNLKPNMKVVETLRKLSECNIPIVVVSSAPNRRVEDDLIDIKKLLKIDSFYSREQFTKRCTEDWDKLIETYGCERILYFGNDCDEDKVTHEKVLSVIINR